MANRPPLRNLPKKAFPPKGTVRPTQTLYHFGVPVTRRFVVEYARHFHLTFDLDEDDREEFRGKEHMDFADVKSITISLSKGVLNNE